MEKFKEIIVLKSSRENQKHIMYVRCVSKLGIHGTVDLCFAKTFKTTIEAHNYIQKHKYFFYSEFDNKYLYHVTCIKTNIKILKKGNKVY